MVETHAIQASGFNGIFDHDFNMEDTPMAPEGGDQAGGHGAMTPMISHTPSLAGMYGAASGATSAA